MGYNKEFIKDTIRYGIGRGIRRFIGIFLLPFYTRALSPEEYGILATLATFSMFVSAILEIGLDSAAGFYFFQPKNEKEKGRILFTLFVIRVIIIIPALILSFFSETIATVLFNDPGYTSVVFITCLTIPAGLIISEQVHVYRYFREIGKYNIITIINAILGVFGGIILVVILKYGVFGAQLSTLLSSTLLIVLSFVLYTRKKYYYVFSWYWAKRMLRFGFPLIWAAIATWVFSSSDRFFLLHYSSLQEIGWYSIGSTFSQPILLLNMAVQMSFGVLFIQIYNEEMDSKKVISKKMAIDSFNIYLVIAISISVFVSIFSNELLLLITTPEYLMGALAIPFLTFSLISKQAYQTMGPGITLAEKTWHYTWITILTAVLNIILNFIFIPIYGFVGAAFTTFVSLNVYWLTEFFIAQHYFYINYKLVNVLMYYITAFIFSILVPFTEIYLHYEYHILCKILLLIVAATMPFIFRLISLDEFWRRVISLVNRVK